MTLEVDFVPFATGAGANVTAQSTYVSETTTGTGYQSGVAVSADCNKAWRQGTVMAAALANYIANTLNQNVLDDGNLSTQITQLTDAIESTATAEAQTVVANATINGSQISGAITVSAAITATSFNVSSDERLKDSIAPIEGALERLDLMRGVTFTWRERPEDGHYAGVIAQDVARAIPEAVREVEGHLRVDPMAVVGLLVEALREERSSRLALETRLAALEGR